MTHAVGSREPDGKLLLKMNVPPSRAHRARLSQPFPLGTDADKPVRGRGIGAESTIADLMPTTRRAARRDATNRPKSAILSPPICLMS